MSGTEEYIICPECGYEKGYEHTDWKDVVFWRHCERCGYTVDFQGEPEDCLPLILGHPPAPEVWLRGPRIRRCEVSGGTGLCWWRMKEGEQADETVSGDPDESGYVRLDIDGNAPREQVCLDNMKELDRYEFFKISFRKNGKWFIKNLVTKKISPFPKPPPEPAYEELEKRALE